MVKKMILAVGSVCAFAVLVGQQAGADEYVRGYFRSNGTYVAPHYRSNPDGNFYNNWSTYPNVNPYTGQTGTHHTPRHYPSYNYPSYDYSSYPSYNNPSYQPPRIRQSYGSPWGY